VVLSEVAIAGGWVEIYNRAPTAADLLGWSLADNRNSSLTITRTMVIDGNGFVVVPMKNLDKATQLFLKRPGGSTADEAKLAPVASDRSWSRYPAHGGVWTLGTILTPGAFNVLAPQDVPAVNVDRTEPAPEPKIARRETALAPRVAVLAVLLLAAIAFAARQVLWQRGA